MPYRQRPLITPEVEARLAAVHRALQAKAAAAAVELALVLAAEGVAVAAGVEQLRQLGIDHVGAQLAVRRVERIRDAVPHSKLSRRALEQLGALERVLATN